MIDLLFEDDTLIQLAVGSSRKTQTWKNIEIKYSEFVEKLSHTHRTTETLAEYLSMSKDVQGDIKDVGGFVGGELREGKRKNGYVNYRSMLTLDIDYGVPGVVEEFTTKCKNFAHIFYSTHKSSLNKPRLRFIVPLKRKVSPEEYEACGRKLAYLLGINYFDDSTYEPARLMYWGSTPIDQEYIFRYNDAYFLNPDELLSLYTDWRDVSLWHYSDRVGVVRDKQIKKEASKPLDKSGLIGAFCKTYNIEEAISTFLTNVYKPTSRSDRYTFIDGSTSGGLVLYGSDFAFSNHSTDPCSGKLCNSFDLVRLSLFSELDFDAKENTPVNKLPSFIKMCELAREDKLVKAKIDEETYLEIQEQMEALDVNTDNDNEDVHEVEEDSSSKVPEWFKKLDKNKSGLLPTFNNFALILKNDKKLNGIGGINLLSGKKEVLVDTLPWKRIGKLWNDTDEACLRGYLETIYNLEGIRKIQDATEKLFTDNSFHPIHDYLDSLKWDGKARMENLLIDYLGAEDSSYVREITLKFMIAAVKRIIEPGCKFDNMLVLVGSQGIGKSTIFQKLVGSDWFSDSVVNIQGKEAFEAIEGKWIIELPELAVMCKYNSTREAVKTFFSKTTDSYRKAYGRNTIDIPRQCVFVGTTNENDFLNDPTGNRRFWIVKTNQKMVKKSIWDDLTKEEINQIWAEAYHLYKTDKTINVAVLTEATHEKLLQMQEDSFSIDSRSGLVEDFLEIALPVGWYELEPEQKRYWIETEGKKKHLGTKREFVSSVELWTECFGRNRTEISNKDTKWINDIMRKIPGWRLESGRKTIKGYGRQRFYVRENESDISFEDL